MKNWRISGIHILLLCLLASFNNCSTGFESGERSGAGESASTSAGESPVGEPEPNPIPNPEPTPPSPNRGENLAGKVYVVDSVNGNDANSGLSVRQAWKTLNRVNQVVTRSGSDVCLIGEFDNQQLTVDWPGTLDDPSVVGGCYVDGSALHWMWEGPDPLNQKNLAVIDGSFESEPGGCATRNPIDCEIQSSRAVPTAYANGLVKVAADNVHIKGLLIRDSAGMGLQMSGRSVDDGLLENIVVAHVRTRNNAFSALMIQNGVMYSAFVDIDSKFDNACERAEDEGRTGGRVVANCGAKAQPSCLKFTGNSTKNIPGDGLSYNVLALSSVYECAGEGMGVLSQGMYIAHNVAGEGGVNYYTAGDDLIFSRNIATGVHAGHVQGNGQGGFGNSLETSNEVYQMKGNILRINNMAVGTRRGMWFGNATSHRVDEGLGFGSWDIFNTVVMTEQEGFFSRGAAGAMLHWHAYGNVSASSGAADCDNKYGDKASMNDNLWAQTAEVSCLGPGDKIQDPGFTKSKQWYRDFAQRHLNDSLQAENFRAPAGEEMVRDVQLPPALRRLASDPGFDRPMKKFMEIKRAGTLLKDHWPKCSGAIPKSITDGGDFFCNPRGAAPYDAGAIERE